MRCRHALYHLKQILRDLESELLPILYSTCSQLEIVDDVLFKQHRITTPTESPVRTSQRESKAGSVLRYSPLEVQRNTTVKTICGRWPVDLTSDSIETPS